MKRIYWMSLLLPMLSFAQKTQHITPAADDPKLVVTPFSCQYSADGPLYIINAKSIIYQDCSTRKYLDADVQTFRFARPFGSSEFAMDKDGIFFKGERVSADTTGFKLVGMAGEYQNRVFIWKNRSDVFRNTSEIQGADAQTFKNVPGNCPNFFSDKDGVFFVDRRIDGSQTVDINAIRETMCAFNGSVYSSGKRVTLDGEPLVALNVQFAKTSKKIIDIQNSRVLELDANKAKVLSRSYITDGKNLYCGLYKVDLPQKFLPGLKVFDQASSRYLIHGKAFLGDDGLMAKIDAPTFGMLPNSDIFYDKNGIYRREFNEKSQKVVNVKYPFQYSVPVKASDIRFSNLNYRYLIYKNQVYDVADKEFYGAVPTEKLAKLLSTNMRLTKSNGKSEDRSDYDYNLYKAGGKLYAGTKEMHVDVPTFGLKDGLYKDEDHVYGFVHGGELSILEGVDAQTAVNRMGFIFDKNFVYLHNFKLIENSNAEILALFSGYRPGCGLDRTPNSDFYLLRNDAGFWLVRTEATVTLRFLGKTLPADWHPNLKDFEVR